LSDSYSIYGVLRKADAFFPLLLVPLSNTPLESSKKKKTGTSEIETYQHLFYADDGINLRENIEETTKKNTKFVFKPSKKINLSIHSDKSKCKFMHRHQNSIENHVTDMASKLFGNGR
jgi:hypothetical protein